MDLIAAPLRAFRMTSRSNNIYISTGSNHHDGGAAAAVVEDVDDVRMSLLLRQDIRALLMATDMSGKRSSSQADDEKNYHNNNNNNNSSSYHHSGPTTTTTTNTNIKDAHGSERGKEEEEEEEEEEDALSSSSPSSQSSSSSSLLRNIFQRFGGLLFASAALHGLGLAATVSAAFMLSRFLTWLFDYSEAAYTSQVKGYYRYQQQLQAAVTSSSSSSSSTFFLNASTSAPPTTIPTTSIATSTATTITTTTADGILFAALVGALLLVGVVCEGFAATIALRVMMRLQRALSAMVCEALHAAPTAVLDTRPDNNNTSTSTSNSNNGAVDVGVGTLSASATTSTPPGGEDHAHNVAEEEGCTQGVGVGVVDPPHPPSASPSSTPSTVHSTTLGPREARRLLDTALPQLMDIGGKRLHLFWSTPLLAAGATYLLVTWVSWAGAAVLFLILFSYTYLIPAVLHEGKVGDVVKLLAAARAQKVAAVLENMAVLRANGWLEALLQEPQSQQYNTNSGGGISEARKVEEAALRRRTFAQTVMVGAATFNSHLVELSFVAIIFYVPVAFFPGAATTTAAAAGGANNSPYFTAGNIFPANVLCGYLRSAATYMPLSLLNLRTFLQIIADCEALLRAFGCGGDADGTSSQTLSSKLDHVQKRNNDYDNINTQSRNDHRNKNDGGRNDHPPSDASSWCFGLSLGPSPAPPLHQSNSRSAQNNTDDGVHKHTPQIVEHSSSSSVLYLPRHAIIAVTGPTGCGKSALLKLLAGEDVRHYFSLNGCGVRRNGRSVYVAQDGFVFDGTVAENICGAEGRPLTKRTAAGNSNTISGTKKRNENHHHHESKKDKEEEGERGKEYDRVEALMTICGMDMQKFTPHSFVSSTTLSGGERLRISLARALFSSAETVLLDEPVSALDPDIAEDFIADVLAPLREMRLKTFIIATNHPRITGIIASKSGHGCAAAASPLPLAADNMTTPNTSNAWTSFSASSPPPSLSFGEHGIADYCLDMRQRPYDLVSTTATTTRLKREKGKEDISRDFISEIGHTEEKGTRGAGATPTAEKTEEHDASSSSSYLAPFSQSPTPAPTIRENNNQHSSSDMMSMEHLLLLRRQRRASRQSGGGTEGSNASNSCSHPSSRRVSVFSVHQPLQPQQKKQQAHFPETDHVKGEDEENEEEKDGEKKKGDNRTTTTAPIRRREESLLSSYRYKTEGIKHIFSDDRSDKFNDNPRSTCSGSSHQNASPTFASVDDDNPRDDNHHHPCASQGENNKPIYNSTCIATPTTSKYEDDNGSPTYPPFNAVVTAATYHHTHNHHDPFFSLESGESGAAETGDKLAGNNNDRDFDDDDYVQGRGEGEGGEGVLHRRRCRLGGGVVPSSSNILLTIPSPTVTEDIDEDNVSYCQREKVQNAPLTTSNHQNNDDDLTSSSSPRFDPSSASPFFHRLAHASPPDEFIHIITAAHPAAAAVATNNNARTDDYVVTAGGDNNNENSSSSSPSLKTTKMLAKKTAMSTSPTNIVSSMSSSSSSDLITGLCFLVQSVPWHLLAALFLLGCWRTSAYGSERGLADAVARSPFLGRFSSISQSQSFMIFLISNSICFCFFIAMCVPLTLAFGQIQHILFKHLRLSIQHASYATHAALMRSGRLPTAVGSGLAAADALVFPLTLTLVFAFLFMFYAFLVIFALHLAAVGIGLLMLVCTVLTVMYLRISDSLHAQQSLLQDTTGRLQSLVTERALDVRCHDLSVLLRTRLMAAEGQTLRTALVAGCWSRWTEMVMDVTVSLFCGGFCLYAALDTIHLLPPPPAASDYDVSSSFSSVPMTQAVLQDRLSRLFTACFAAMALKVVVTPFAFETTTLVHALRLLGAAVSTSLALRAAPDPYTTAKRSGEKHNPSLSFNDEDDKELNDHRVSISVPTHRASNAPRGGVFRATNLWMRYGQLASAPHSLTTTTTTEEGEKYELQGEETMEEEAASYVLRGLSLPPIPLGTMTLIRGSSGCGKTSLFLALLGLYPLSTSTMRHNKKKALIEKATMSSSVPYGEEEHTSRNEGKKNQNGGPVERPSASHHHHHQHDVSLSLYPPEEEDFGAGVSRSSRPCASVASLDDPDWRQHLLWVPQEAFLIEGSVLENVIFPLLLPPSSTSEVAPTHPPESTSTNTPIPVKTPPTPTHLTTTTTKVDIPPNATHTATMENKEISAAAAAAAAAAVTAVASLAGSRALCRHMLDALDLHSLSPDDRVAARGANLSGGERQRIGIARALATLVMQQQRKWRGATNQQHEDAKKDNQEEEERRRSVILMDEPTSFLEPAACRKVLRVIRQIACEEHGAAVLLISHQNDDALSVVDLCVTLDRGQVTHAYAPANVQV